MKWFIFIFVCTGYLTQLGGGIICPSFIFGPNFAIIFSDMVLSCLQDTSIYGFNIQLVLYSLAAAGTLYMIIACLYTFSLLGLYSYLQLEVAEKLLTRYLENSKYISLHYLIVLLAFSGVSIPLAIDFIPLNLYQSQETHIMRANFLANLSIVLRDQQMFIFDNELALFLSMIFLIEYFLLFILVGIFITFKSLFLYFTYKLSENAKTFFKIMIKGIIIVAIFVVIFIALPLLLLLLSYMFYRDYLTIISSLTFMSLQIYAVSWIPSMIFYLPAYKKAYKKHIIDKIWLFYRRHFSSNTEVIVVAFTNQPVHNSMRVSIVDQNNLYNR